MTTDTPEVVETAIARQEPQTQVLAPQSLTPAQMLSIAVQQDAPVEKIEKLMDLQQRWEANEARKAFEVAMVAFSAKVPTIIKTRVVDFTTQKGRTHYTHAGLPETVEQIQDLMAECQLSRRWKDEEPKKQGNIRIRCIVSHILGHSESFSAEAPPDQSGNKNDAQAVASIITYLRRTTLFSILGLVANDEVEDDGAGGKTTPPPQPKSTALTDPAEQQARKDLWNLAQKKAGVQFTREQILDLFVRVQQASGKQTAVECLAWLGTDDVLIGKDGGLSFVTYQSGEADPFAESEPPAAAPGPPTASSSEPPDQPPAFQCDKCLQTYPVTTAQNKCVTKGCKGKVRPRT